ncbi:uncharacterized protein LOC115218132 [Argonauta hians]
MCCMRHPDEAFYRTNWDERAFTVGIQGPVGSGKTSIILALCKILKDRNICIVTNDFYSTVDADTLLEQNAVPKEKIRSVVTEGCPARTNNDVNLKEIKELTQLFHPEIILLESAGDCLAAHFDSDLVDYTILVIDIAGGRNVIRKRIAGNDYSELLVVNKMDLADTLDIDIEDFKSEVIMTRMDRGLLFTSVKNDNDMKDLAECISYTHRDQMNQVPPECP